MLRSATTLIIAATMLTAASHAAPDQRAIAEGHDAAVGVGRTPAAAVSIESCETVAGRPGYDCTFSISVCFDGDTPIPQCDDPGYSERALFVGGDNGWIALDIQYSSETAPHVPLDPSSPLMSDFTPQWLEGYWNFDNCENDGGLTFDRNGRYAVMGGIGRWNLAENILTITLTHEINVGVTADHEPIAEPWTIRWPVDWIGPNTANITLENGENRQIIRC